MAYILRTTYKKLLADTVTPVSIYLKLRDKFINSILLESSDYHGNENSYSYICCQPIARFELADNTLTRQYPDGSGQQSQVRDRREVVEALDEFCTQFKTEEHSFPFINNGIFGYIAYNTVRYFEDIELLDRKGEENSIPDMVYQVFKYVMVINHFKNELYIFEHAPEKGHSSGGTEGIDYIVSLIQNKNFPSYTFSLQGEETTNLSDQEFLKVLASGQHHCQIGDVFQIVLSRRFSRKFAGDEFNVYRALRSVILPLICFTSILVVIKFLVLHLKHKSRFRTAKPVYTPLPVLSAVQAMMWKMQSLPRNYMTILKRMPNM
jgi:anthranilate synthase component 1